LAAGCGTFDVFAQIDGPWHPGACFLPQLWALNRLHDAYPNATLLLPTLSATRWVKSYGIKQGSEVRGLLKACNLPTCGPACVDDDYQLAAFYDEHT